MITVEDLKSHLYSEKVALISREDPAIAEAACQAAIVEAKGYMGAYDTEAIFSKAGAERNPLLLLFLKDMAVWHFVNLCNAGTDMELRLNRYERAVSWFKELQKGNIGINLPKKPDPMGAEAPGSTVISWHSNEKKEQHF